MFDTVDVHADLTPVRVVQVCLEAFHVVDGLGVPSVPVVSLNCDLSHVSYLLFWRFSLSPVYYLYTRLTI